ncbi:efflux transporter outer membrane subunit [Asticcacaulis machinosus]|uniref:Efflux transporter outer membrane subunit n=1 Tax=Asticcacaulis machinosus TaxID=2984211 RepID=A0ABT5HKN4_9CAUL|nr:efflux transporter outer membrane subunit [Asticcacaulis machinosus]MDC7676690.1 efflux transporter outer membrane subunit [Asticcacaulis machinosus]
MDSLPLKRRFKPVLALCVSLLALTGGVNIAHSAPKSEALDVATTFKLPAAPFWMRYGDPQLDRLMADAINTSPSLAVAEARLRKAKASFDGSKGADVPTLSFLGTAQKLGSSGGPDGEEALNLDELGVAGLNFGWELDFWGKNRAAVAAASSQARASEADMMQAGLILTTSIATAYIDLARLYDERDLAVRAVEVRGDSADLVQQKFDNGLTNRAELQLANAGSATARAEVAAIDEQIAATRNLIAALAGRDPVYGQSLARPALKASATFALPERIDLDLIGRRPDVVAAKWRAEASTQGVKRAKAAFYPNVNLMAFVGKVWLGDLSVEGTTNSNFGPAITLPLFDGGKRKSDLRGAKADKDAAVADYNAAIVNAMHGVADVVASERALEGRLKDSQAALDGYEEAYRLTKLRYDGGLSNYTTLLQAEQSLLTQRKTVTDLKSRALSLDVALVRALGGDY